MINTIPIKASSSGEHLLLKRLSKGERTAFWSLWMPHQDYLYHRCLTWMDGNVVDAEEALSQATLKAWDKLFLHADKITNLKAWLTRLTHNLCTDIHRGRGREAIGVDNIEEIALSIEVLIFPVESPESKSALLDSELGITIRCAINALPPRLRSPFISANNAIASLSIPILLRAIAQRCGSVASSCMLMGWDTGRSGGKLGLATRRSSIG